jgi:4-carboxymuconolactone decarboxylase
MEEEPMSRVPALEMGELSAEQRRIHDEIAGARSGAVRGPFAIWLRLPHVADKANQFGNALRLQGTLDRRLFELMVLVVARHWSAQYEWFAHEPNARRAGLSGEVVEAIRDRRLPGFAREDEKLVYEIVTEINETRTLSQPSYDRALAALGLESLIELVAAAGFYTAVAMTINVFDAPVPDGSRPLP